MSVSVSYSCDSFSVLSGRIHDRIAIAKCAIN